MATLTIRIPDDKHQRLQQLAKHRSLSVDRLIEELATIGLMEYDTECRFRTLAERGSTEEGLALLDQLDRAFQTKPGGE